jgi:hypothetical protein
VRDTATRFGMSICRQAWWPWLDTCCAGYNAYAVKAWLDFSNWNSAGCGIGLRYLICSRRNEFWPISYQSILAASTSHGGVCSARAEHDLPAAKFSVLVCLCGWNLYVSRCQLRIGWAWRRVRYPGSAVGFVFLAGLSLIFLQSQDVRGEGASS